MLWIVGRLKALERIEQSLRKAKRKKKKSCHKKEKSKLWTMLGGKKSHFSICIIIFYATTGICCRCFFYCYLWKSKKRGLRVKCTWLHDRPASISIGAVSSSKRKKNEIGVQREWTNQKKNLSSIPQNQYLQSPNRLLKRFWSPPIRTQPSKTVNQRTMKRFSISQEIRREREREILSYFTYVICRNRDPKNGRPNNKNMLSSFIVSYYYSPPQHYEKQFSIQFCPISIRTVLLSAKAFIIKNARPKAACCVNIFVLLIKNLPCNNKMLKISRYDDMVCLAIILEYFFRPLFMFVLSRDRTFSTIVSSK